jgi:hypothetical protein
MSILSLVTALFALGLFLWLAAVYFPADRDGWRPGRRTSRDAAVPIPVLADRSGTTRPRGEVNPPATMRSS